MSTVGGSPPDVGEVVMLHVEKAVDGLAEEFDGVHKRIAELMDDSVRQLAGKRQVEDWPSVSRGDRNRGP